MRGGRFVGTAAVVFLTGIVACVGDDPGNASPQDDAGTPDGGGPTGDAANDGGGGGDSATGCTDSSDTSADKNNCGSCGHVCSGSFACTAGKCGNEVEDLAQGARFGCVLLHEGSVWCWGNNSDGELGVDPSVADNVCGANKCRATPQKIPGLSNVKQISAGARHACALDASGALKCWGRNDYSQLAQPTSTAFSSMPIPVTFTPSATIVQVSAGEDVTCARTSNKDVYCWGANDQAAAGKAASTTPVTDPNLLATFNHDVADVRVSMDAGSGAHACAIRDSGTVWCWGTNGNGEGARTGGADEGCQGNVCTATPKQAGTISGVTALSVGPGSTCAIAGGNVQCWGTKAFGAFGSISTGGNYTPTSVTGLPTNTITTLVQGAYSEFGTSASGDVWSWGALDDGALGDGLTTGDDCSGMTCRTGGAVAQLTTLKDVVKIAFKYKGGTALKKDGSVVAWGLNDTAQLGHLPSAAGAGDQICGSDVCHPLPVVVTLP